MEVVEQRYRAVSPLGEGERPGEATVGFAWDAFTAELVVDADGVVRQLPGRGVPDARSRGRERALSRCPLGGTGRVRPSR